jgi:hypothetical protein
MKRLLLISFLLFILLLGLACKNNISLNKKQFKLGKIYKKESQLYNKLFTVFGMNIGSYEKIGNKYIILKRVLNQSRSAAGILYELDNSLNMKKIKKINYGKGPNQGINLTDILKLNNKYYLFDKKLHRFLVYDENFNYLDTYNLNRPIPVSSFYKYNNKIYAVYGEPERIVFYSTNFKKRLKLEKVYEFEYGNKNIESKHVNSGRKKVTIVEDNFDYFITLAFNVICIFNKEDKIIKDKEIYLGYEEIEKGRVVVPHVIFTNKKNITFYNKDYFYYFYKEDSLKQINFDNYNVRFRIQFKNKIYSFTYNENENNKIYLKKKE